MLRAELSEYANPDMKVKRMVDKGLLIPIMKGLYETERSTQGHYLAGALYGPSYLSFEFALSYHGLIPEAVYHFTCATFERKRSKQYDTPFGVYTYRDVPSNAYPVEVMLKFENGYSYQIATAEKAICDILYKASPLPNINDLRYYLFEDLRISESDFYSLNLPTMSATSQLYKTKNHKLLCALIRKETKNGSYLKSDDSVL